MRYERKYQINHLSKAAVEQAVMLHPAGFRKIFPNRQVNNIYFDTIDYQTGRHNIEGVNQRKKYRLRWYGTHLEAITQPRFEIKIKHNELGKKESTNFPDYQLKDLQQITSEVNKQSSSQLLNLQATLLNTYHRSYFGTSNGKFRITIDWNLAFRSPLTQETFSQQSIEVPQVILELKYEEAEEEAAKDILKYLPFRQTKSSKYVTGILLGNSV